MLLYDFGAQYSPRAGAERAKGNSSAGLNLASPEAAWDHSRTTMLAGNYDVALECCCPDNTKIVERLQKFGKIKTKRVFRRVTSIEKVFQDNKAARYKVHRDVNGTNLTTYVSFARVEDQRKIAGY